MATGTVERTLILLQRLAESQGDTTIKALSAAVDLPPSTVHRLLGLLVEQGMVERGAYPRSYRVGTEFYRMSMRVVSNCSLKDLVDPVLKRVVSEVGETCMLMRYFPEAKQVLLEHFVDGPSQLRYFVRFNDPLSLVWGAPGRAILANLPAAEIEEILNQNHSMALNREPLPSIDEMRTILDQIRTQGYAKSSGQQVESAVGLATPVFTGGDAVFGSVCATVPSYRYDIDNEEKFANALRGAAVELSDLFGDPGSASKMPKENTDV